jgi:pimeloyl-ACP methyl ester carboxylesterase
MDNAGAILFRHSPDSGTTWDPPLNQSALNLSLNLSPVLQPQIAVAGANTYVIWADGSPGTPSIFFRRAVVIPARTPQPIILVHGFGSNPSDAFGNMKSLLMSDAGYKAEDIYEYDYRSLTSCSSDPNTTIELIAADFAQFIKSKLHSFYPIGTQADVIAHSMGGLVVRSYMVGMAPAPNGSLLPYGNEIRRLMIAGTPNYGVNENLLEGLIAGRCSGLKTQAGEMEFGARFLWDLDHKWLAKVPVDPGNFLVIAGTAYGVSDGLVRTASATLPEDFFLPVGHILYVPYQHCHNIPLICPGTQPESLVYVQDTSHLTYKIVKEFLSSGHPPSQPSLGYQPSNVVLDESLLLLRMVDKATQTPIAPPPAVTVSCPRTVLSSGGPTVISNRDSDAGTITVVGIQASLWSLNACSVEVKNSASYLGTSINDITISLGLPNIRVVELTQRRDISH